MEDSSEAVFDSLPYIDSEPTPTARAAAEKLINASILTPSQQSSAQLHPTLQPVIEPELTPILTELLQRASLQQSRTDQGDKQNPGIDLTRYSGVSRPTTSPDAESYAALLDQTYTLSTYLRHRGTNLALLERFGKNAWLTGNAQLEDELRALERAIEQTDGEIAAVNRARHERQHGVRAEVEALEAGWKEALGRALEAEIAAGEMGRRVIEVRRGGQR